jgi:ribokinase
MSDKSMSSSGTGVAILGIYVADLAFRAVRLPRIGETLLGSGFAMGPGGKGSNQAVAAARAGNGTPVSFITKLGRDAFAEIGIGTWKADGIVTDFVAQTEEHATGAAFIFVSTETGDNAIIVSSGAAGTISTADIDAAAVAIERSAVFVTQFEQPIDAARRGLEIARAAGVTTILNPAPAVPVNDSLYALCDYVTPNESEASAITGLPVETIDQARAAGDDLLRRGAGVALITLGDKGVLYHSAIESVHVPSFAVAKVVDTTGAGDAFNGGFAVALAEGRAPLDAVRFACATAALSVGKFGTAQSMPARSEVERQLNADR